MTDKRIRTIIGHLLSGNDEKAKSILAEMVEARKSEIDPAKKIVNMLESVRRRGDNDV